MLEPIRWIICVVCRLLLSLRYRVKIHGLAEARRLPGPYLILPNHPAFIDPPNLLVRLWPAFRMRPVFLETNFRSPALAPFAWLLRGIRVPAMDQSSAAARVGAGGAIRAAADALGAGDNVIVWPSGRLTTDGVERVGAARTAAELLTAFPGVTVVLARTRGLWGSSLSCARGRPPLVRSLLRGAGLLAANLLFFSPRRRVEITLEAFGPADRPEPARERVNRWLESWFNADTPREEPTHVPGHFLFGRRGTVAFPLPPALAPASAEGVPASTRRAVADILEEKLGRPLDDAENAAEATFAELGLDSLEAMEVTLRVEQTFGYIGATVPTTVGQLWALAGGLADSATPRPAPAAWSSQKADLNPADVPGGTLAEAIVTQALRRPRRVIAADDLAGAVTCERLLAGAWAMARRFREIPAPAVGLLMPASVAADMAFLALQLAGKVPVALNWTTGPANLEHAARSAGLTLVVTSRAFIDRTQVEVPGPQFLFLEDLRAGIGRFELLRRLLTVRWFPGRAKARLLEVAAVDSNAAAVVLFTSGSEKAPKAVPLTHANILSVVRGAVAEFGLTRADAVLGFLPIFHSFGLVVTTVLPLSCGARVVHHPDPTDARALVRKAAAYRPTLVAGTPTFLGQLLDRAEEGNLDSLRLVVSGAEAAPGSLFEKVKRLAPAAEAVEGYGITETAAVVSVHRPGRFRAGTLGEPLPGVEVRVADLETGERLPAGHVGMLLVTGPNVFPGYLGADAPDPFREADGRRWYVTGDLGELDAGGRVVFRGRLKRFLKAGGEMVSLPALEEPFGRRYPPAKGGPRVAVEGVDGPSGRRVVLFTTETVSLREANAVLQAEGFRGVMRLDEVTRLERIPVLGTGKVDYRQLRAIIDSDPG